jgi:hypothetical protein
VSTTSVHLRAALSAASEAANGGYVRVTVNYRNMLPPVPWVIRGNNCLLSLALILIAGFTLLVAVNG